MRGVKRIAAALLAALLVLSLAACGTQKTGLRLYYPADLSAKHKSVGGSDAITGRAHSRAGGICYAGGDEGAGKGRDSL